MYPGTDVENRRERLMAEIENLRGRLDETMDTLRAIQLGEVDALVISEREGDRVYTLKSPDRTYQRMIEEMAQGAVTTTLDGTILYCNGGLARMLGTTIENLVGSSLRLYVSPDSLDLLDALQHQGGNAQGEVELRAANGATFPVYLAWTALQLDDERVLCGVVTDLTEQKRNEQVFADEKLARSILEHSAEATVVCDVHGKIVRASSEAHRLCGCNPLLQPLDEAFPLAIRSREIPDSGAVLRRALAGERLRGLEASLEDGRMEVVLSAGPLWGAEQEVQGCIVTFTDITSRRRIEQELESAWAAAEQMNQAKDRFLANLSHELRTPLTPVLAVISGLEAGDRVPQHLRGDLAIVRRNIELEARLIDDLLDLTRISRGKVDLQRRAVALEEILDYAIQTCCSEKVQQGVLHVVKDLCTPHPLWVDAPRLTQVFWNLFSNAVKFTPPGGTITVRSWEEDDGAWIEVSDTGIGIEPEYLPRIFDAFEQGEPKIQQRFGGLGLGLAISKAIVEMHGGQILALSNGVGQGSTFRVQLPLASIPTAVASASEDRPGAAGAAQTRPLTILLVEDHVDTAATMAELLSLLGHQVTVADSVSSGLAEAERLQQEGGIDLVLSDLGLPDASGLDLMRELSRRYGLKGIALSGYGMEDDLRRSLEAGFAKHLTKPINFQVLQEVLREVSQAG
jgi:two-component system CheB/CheR fusion protein